MFQNKYNCIKYNNNAKLLLANITIKKNIAKVRILANNTIVSLMNAIINQEK